MFTVILLAMSALAAGLLFPWLSNLQTNSSSDTQCSLDQSSPPGNLTLCGNQTLFMLWRPKARFIAPQGWMNDPMALFQFSDGTYHAGYQFNPMHIQWGNISMGAAHSKDLTYWTDCKSCSSIMAGTLMPMFLQTDLGKILKQSYASSDNHEIL